MAQTIFPITPVQVTYNVPGWTGINLGAYVPVGIATGGIFRIVNSSAGVRPYGIRQGWSSDARFEDVSGHIQCCCFIGINAVGDIAWNNVHLYSNRVQAFLLAYTIAGVEFPTVTHAPDISPGLDAWTAVNLGPTGLNLIPATATGVVLEVHQGPAYELVAYGARMNGSTDNRITDGAAKNQFAVVVGCDANQVIELYRGAGTLKFFLQGYITDGVTFYLNAQDVSPLPVGSWAALNPPANTVIPFLEITNGGRWELRSTGYSLPKYLYGSHVWGTIGCPNGGLEGIQSVGGGAMHLVGYATMVIVASVSTKPATSVAINSATLNGTLDDDGGEACDCGFEWGETVAYGNTTPTQSKTTGQTFSQGITGLDPRKTYHFRAFATNSFGTGYGADRTFTTLAAAPTTDTDPATDIEDIAAALNGELTYDGGEACDCGFEWGETVAYGNTTPTQSRTTGQIFSQIISGLTPGTPYHFLHFF
ncbi:hypothetical protein ES703_110293 [subsurface metagenome]